MKNVIKKLVSLSSTVYALVLFLNSCQAPSSETFNEQSGRIANEFNKKSNDFGTISDLYSVDWNNTVYKDVISEKYDHMTITPVSFDKQKKVYFKMNDQASTKKDAKGAKKIDDDAFVNLVLYLKGTTPVDTLLAIIIPEKKSNKHDINAKNFSGTIFFTNLDLTKVEGTAEYSNGTLIKAAKSARARLTQTVCMDYYYQTCVGDQCGPVTFSYSTCGQVETSDNSPLNSSVIMVNDGGGGGTPGSGSTSYLSMIQDLDGQLTGMNEVVGLREIEVLNRMPQRLLAHIWYRQNILDAVAASYSKFGQGPLDCQDNKCNGFRHAYFSALNAYYFGPNGSKELGEAREGMTLQTCDCATQPANYMDLYNNRLGYENIYNENVNLVAFDFNAYRTNALNKSYYYATHNGVISFPVPCP